MPFSRITHGIIRHHHAPPPHTHIICLQPAPPHVRSLSAEARAPFGRAGVLQQAVVLESLEGALGAVALPLPGHDGQLPKLDMYWLLKYYTGGWVQAPFVSDPLPPPRSRAVQAAVRLVRSAAGERAAAAAGAHLARLSFAARFAAQQARGQPLGAHAAFKTASVDAVTLRLLPRDPSAPVAAGGAAAAPLPRAAAVAQLAEALELAVRSCSVLIEKFHHSFFLYVLTDARAFVSVERYIGAAAAPLLAMVLQAAAAMRRQDAALGGAPAPALLAADRAQWLAAARAALLAHAAAAAAGWALREAAGGGGLWSGSGGSSEAVAALLRALSSGSGGAAGDDSARSLGLALGAALLLMLGAGEVAQLLAASPDRGAQQKRVPRAVDGAAWRRKLAVVELSGVAAALAALACLNWALAAAVAAACAALAVACGGRVGGGQEETAAAARGASGGGSGRRGAAAVAAWAVWLLASPPALLLAAAVAQSGWPLPPAALSLAALRRLAAAGSAMAHHTLWGLYVPFWLLSGYTALCPPRTVPVVM